MEPLQSFVRVVMIAFVSGIQMRRPCLVVVMGPVRLCGMGRDLGGYPQMSSILDRLLPSRSRVFVGAVVRTSMGSMSWDE